MIDKIPAQRPDASIAKIGLPPVRREIPDSVEGGLYLVVQPSGAKSWAIRGKLGGRAVKITLGRYDDLGKREARPAEKLYIEARNLLTVVEARQLAKQATTALRRGTDPRLGKADDVTPAHWLTKFMDAARTTGFKKGRGPVKASTAAEYERIIEANVKPAWKNVTDLRTLDSHDIDTLIAKQSRGMQRNTFAVLSIFFKWKPVKKLIGRDLIEDVDAPAVLTSRTRVLTESEVARVWAAAEKCGYPFGPMVQLLLLTGQRRDEIADVKWDEFSEADRTLTLEGSRTKNGNAHVVPLSQTAMEIFAKLPRVADSKGKPSEYVFTTTATTPFSGFSNAKNALDKRCGDDPAIPEWRLHDLRRTASTMLAKLGIKQEVTEALLNHKTGKVSGIAEIYNRYDYHEEKRDAVNKLSDKIIAINALVEV